MRVKVRTLRRAGLCLFLGVATSWLVAWGLVIAAWRGAWRLPMDGETAGAAVVGPHLIWAMAARAPGCTYELWYALPIDEPSASETIAPGQALPYDDPIAIIEDWKEGASEYHMKWDARTAEAFPGSLAARLVGDASECEVQVHGVGWPLATVSQVTITPGSFSSGSPLHDTASFEIPWLKGSDPLWDWGNGPVDPIHLPYRPNWPGLAINTAFYSGIFAVPLFGIPALRRTLRTRRGRCPACNYDLSATPDGPCPECGAVRSVPAG